MLFAQGGGAVDWINLLQTFGLAVVILFAVAYGVWKGVGWLGREIVIPGRDKVISRFFDFLAKIEITVEKLDINMDKATLNLDRQTGALESLEKLSLIQGEATKIAAKMDIQKDQKLDGLSLGHKEIVAEIKEVKAEVAALKVAVEKKL